MTQFPNFDLIEKIYFDNEIANDIFKELLNQFQMIFELKLPPREIEVVIAEAPSDKEFSIFNFGLRIMALEVLILKDKKYLCPRCGRREEIIDHNEWIECISCDLEFDKSDLESFDGDDILSRSEKQGIIKVLLDEMLKD
ncbi:MAG: hypothetical protein ACTSV5_10035 [Promethearchaeota archaeon]